MAHRIRLMQLTVVVETALQRKRDNQLPHAQSSDGPGQRCDPTVIPAVTAVVPPNAPAPRVMPLSWQPEYALGPDQPACRAYSDSDYRSLLCITKAAVPLVIPSIISSGVFQE